jgi:hypothetical protein
MAEAAQHAQLAFDVPRVRRASWRARDRRHVRLGHDVARIVEVDAMPLVAIAAADARQVRPGALAAPLERAVVDELARHRVVAVALGLGAERPDHLRVAVVAALAHVDVAAGELQGRVRRTPATGCVVERWKKSGTISTRPPTLTVRITRTISSALLFSILSCVNFIYLLSPGKAGTTDEHG